MLDALIPTVGVDLRVSRRRVAFTVGLVRARSVHICVRALNVAAGTLVGRVGTRIDDTKDNACKALGI